MPSEREMVVNNNYPYNNYNMNTPPNYYNQGNMPPPYYPYAWPPPKSNGCATASLVLGILGVVFFWFPFIGMICSFLAVIFAIAGMVKGRSGSAVAGLVLGLIGFIIGILLLKSCSTMLAIPLDRTKPAQSPSSVVQESIQSQQDNDFIPLDTILRWYRNNTDAMSTAAVEFIGTQANASNIVITENSFEFSELLGCTYFIYFDCVVDNVAAHGHTTAFMEYYGEEIIWIDFEISTDAEWTVLVEWFDSEAEAKSVEYYYKLIELNGLPTEGKTYTANPSTPSSEWHDRTGNMVCIGRQKQHQLRLHYTI